MKIDSCVIHLIPPEVNVVDDNKFNFLLIGNIKRFERKAGKLLRLIISSKAKVLSL